MKKIKVLLVLVMGLLFLSACSVKKEYTVKFDSKGGTKIEEQIVKKGETVKRPKNPIKDGYIFNGWYLDSEIFDFDTEINENIVLTAKWKISEKLETEEENVCTLTCEEGYAISLENCSCNKIKTSEARTDKIEISVENNSKFNLNSYVKDKQVKSYKSSDEKIAKVDKDGNIEVISAGVVEITVTMTDGSTYIITMSVEDSYSFEAKAIDESDISYKISIYKNNNKLSTEDLEKINAVYSDSGKYIGRYENKYGAIIVDKSQISSIKSFKLEGKTYNLSKMK